MEKFTIFTIALVFLVALVISPLSTFSQSATDEFEITTIAGTGTAGYSGDDGQSTAAQIRDSRATAIDSLGNVYIADTNNHRIRKIDKKGIITTIAGTGIKNFSGDDGQAKDATLVSPSGMDFDKDDNLFIADTLNHRIRKIEKSTGKITTIAGTGTAGYSGDGGLAVQAALQAPAGIAFDKNGDLLISDAANQRIRRINMVSGIITTVAGTGIAGYSGDGGLATSAQLRTPTGVDTDSEGNIYISDSINHRIRKILTDGTILTLAGTGTAGFSGDDGQAISAKLSSPNSVSVDVSGNLYITDTGTSRIRKIDKDGIITTIAGSGSVLGDNGPAKKAQLNRPFGVTVDKNGNIYIADTGNHRIRKLTPIKPTLSPTPTPTETPSPTIFPTPVITPIPTETLIPTPAITPTPIPPEEPRVVQTVAGPGEVNNPYRVASDAAGNSYIADTLNNKIKKVYTNGTIETIAGTGTAGYSGDGELAKTAELNRPHGISVSADGVNVYVADTFNNRVRKINTETGIITTLAGIGEAGYSGDGGPAVEAKLNNPYGVYVDSSENVFIADTLNNRIRKVDVVTGKISTVAGKGEAGYSGDGGFATRAKIDKPMGISTDPTDDRVLYIADTGNNKIRKVDANGKISTVAGGFIEADIILEAINFEYLNIPEGDQKKTYTVEAQVKNPTTSARRVYLVTYVTEPDGSKTLVREADRVPIEIGAGETKVIKLTKQAFEPNGDRVGVHIAIRDDYGNKNSISGIYDTGKVTPISKPKKYVGFRNGISLTRSGNNIIEENTIVPWSPVDASISISSSTGNKLMSNRIYSRGSGHGILISGSGKSQNSNTKLISNDILTRGLASHAIYIKRAGGIDVQRGSLTADGSSVVRVNQSEGVKFKNVVFNRNSIAFDDESEVEIYKPMEIKVSDAETRNPIDRATIDVEDAVQKSKVISGPIEKGKIAIDEIKEANVKGIRGK